MSLKERIESEAKAGVGIYLDNLVCKDCFHRSPRTDICAAYQAVKPKSVLQGGDCKHYKKDKK